MSKVLFVSSLDVAVDNGMLKRQRQLLTLLEGRYAGQVDYLSLGSSPAQVRRWLDKEVLSVNVLGGALPVMARLIMLMWYGTGGVLCNKLKLVDHFPFFIKLPLSAHFLDRYSKIVVYYAWCFHLLDLKRVSKRVVVDMTDVMAHRHTRIGFRRWISLSDRDERAVLESGATCVAISEHDRHEFSTLYGCDIPVLPFFPDNIDALRSLGPPGGIRAVGVLASHSFMNMEMIRLMARPQFLRPLRDAGIRLVIAGGICAGIAPSLLETFRAYDVTILGRVEREADFYSAVSVVLNPVGPSSGIKIKSVEALMAHRQLITTRWGTDESLARAFSERIRVLAWPVDAGTLASACIEHIEDTDLRGEDPVDVYLQLANARIQQIFG